MEKSGQFIVMAKCWDLDDAQCFPFTEVIYCILYLTGKILNTDSVLNTLNWQGKCIIDNYAQYRELITELTERENAYRYSLHYYTIIFFSIYSFIDKIKLVSKLSTDIFFFFFFFAFNQT